MRIGRFLATLACSVSIGAMALSGAAVAQTTPPAANPPVADNEIVVQAERLREMVRSFVEDVSQPGKEGQLARWDRKVCPGVIGAPTAQAQAMIDQIAARALNINLQIGDPGCRANILVIVTPNAASFTPAFVEQNKKLFSYFADNGNSLGQQALEEFKTTGRPVRWWHVAQTVTDRGQVLGSGGGGTPMGTGDGFGGVQVARMSNSGRLSAGTRQDFNRAIIIIDANAVSGAPFPALVDYVAMVSLAQIDPKADVSGTESILTLFADKRDGRPLPAGLTEWDQAYLEGLYGSPRFARSTRRQEGAITDRMERELTKPADPDAGKAEKATN
jgi:hypothetical protein